VHRDSPAFNAYAAHAQHATTDIALRRFALPFLLFALGGCSQSYSPNTYAASAAQQQAAVERGVIVGVRQVVISPDGTIGAATGGAIGGVAGSQVPGSAVVAAFGAIGGTLVGGISGAAAAKAVGNTKAWEYIVQEDGEKLVSITQTSKIALPLGLKVLVIAGTQQARIVPDYTVPIPAPPPPAPPAVQDGPANTEVNIPPLVPAAEPAAPSVAPSPVAADPATDSAPASSAPAAAAPTPGAAAAPEAASGSTAGASTPVPTAPSSTSPAGSTPAVTP
jgi:outer membrane lipoprotein SlyB